MGLGLWESGLIMLHLIMLHQSAPPIATLSLEWNNIGTTDAGPKALAAALAASALGSAPILYSYTRMSLALVLVTHAYTCFSSVWNTGPRYESFGPRPVAATAAPLPPDADAMDDRSIRPNRSSTASREQWRVCCTAWSADSSSWWPTAPKVCTCTGAFVGLITAAHTSDMCVRSRRRRVHLRASGNDSFGFLSKKNQS